MEDLFEELTRGNVTEVKVVLASVVAALAVYQVVLMAVGYGRLRPPFLGAGPASSAHRAIGDAIVVVTVLVAVMCLTYFGLEEDGAVLHAVLGSLLVAAAIVAIVIVVVTGELGPTSVAELEAQEERRDQRIERAEERRERRIDLLEERQESRGE